MVSRLLFGLVVLPLSLQYSSSALSNPPEEFGGGGLQQPSPPPTSGLRVGFYQYTCPNAEAIVRDEMAKIISRVPSLAGPLLRMHFHDCFVNVSVRTWPCSCMHFSTPVPDDGREQLLSDQPSSCMFSEGLF